MRIIYSAVMELYPFIRPSLAVPLDGESFLRFVLRRNHATDLHWDLRVEANGVLHSWFMEEPPTADPQRPVWAGIASPQDPNEMHSERYIGPGQAGTGPMMVEDLGTVQYVVDGYACQDLALHESLLKGRIPFLFDGRVLRGSYVMEFRRQNWQFRKLNDGDATKTPLNWTGISPLSGKTLQDFIPKPKPENPNLHQFLFEY